MDLGIKNRVALVMSAGGGLGSAIALALAREGATVAVSDQNREALENTVSRIRMAGGIAHGFQADLADLENISAMVADVRSTVGDPDILINNSGGPPPSLAAGVAPEQWRNQFDSMVLSLMHLTDLLVAGDETARLGPHHHEYLLRRGRTHTQSRHVQCVAPRLGGLVEDAGQ